MKLKQRIDLIIYAISEFESKASPKRAENPAARKTAFLGRGPGRRTGHRTDPDPFSPSQTAGGGLRSLGKRTSRHEFGPAHSGLTNPGWRSPAKRGDRLRGSAVVGRAANGQVRESRHRIIPGGKVRGG